MSIFLHRNLEGPLYLAMHNSPVGAPLLTLPKFASRERLFFGKPTGRLSPYSKWLNLTVIHRLMAQPSIKYNLLIARSTGIFQWLTL